jgi:hypothetical protein
MREEQNMTWAVINIDHDGDGIYGVSCVQSFVDEESAKEFVKGKKLELSKKYMTLANYNQSYAEAVVVPKDMKLPGWRNFLEEYCYGHNSYTTPETFTRDYKNALRGGTILAYNLQRKRDDYNPPNDFSYYYIVEIK